MCGRCISSTKEKKMSRVIKRRRRKKNLKRNGKRIEIDNGY
jgi:hypothetical protein